MERSHGLTTVHELPGYELVEDSVLEDALTTLFIPTGDNPADAVARARALEFQAWLTDCHERCDGRVWESAMAGARSCVNRCARGGSLSHIKIPMTTRISAWDIIECSMHGIESAC